MLSFGNTILSGSSQKYINSKLISIESLVCLTFLLTYPPPFVSRLSGRLMLKFPTRIVAGNHGQFDLYCLVPF